MRYELLLAPGAAEQLRALDAHARSQVCDALEVHLRHEPMRVSRSRIKRLRGLSRPEYRLRVGDIRACHDVSEIAVEVLAIVTKEQAQAWLAEAGDPGSAGASGEGEG